jgi:putrescine aminotransferase
MREPADRASAVEVFAAERNHLIRRRSGVHKMTGANAYAVAGVGAEVVLSDGRRVIDLATWATSMLGHAHPDVVAAVAEGSAGLPTAARGLANGAAPRLARRLVELARPSRLDRVWFGANGADVVEAALKLARAATGRTGVVAVRGGFHGRTLGALAVSDGDRNRGSFDPLLSGVTYIDPAEPAGRRRWPADTAAVIVEVVPGRGAVEPIPDDALRRLVARARAVGAFVIVDEIQTGLWRSGHYSCALARELDPDAVLFGKTLGGGVMPLSALLCSTELAAPLEADAMLHSQTFSGHPLSCAAALAALDVLPGLVERRAKTVAAWLDGVADRLARGGVAAEVRVDGLMMSLEFAAVEVAEGLVMDCARAGLLIAPCDIDRRVVRLLPPLVLTEEQADKAADILVEACLRSAAQPLPA